MHCWPDLVVIGVRVDIGLPLVEHVEVDGDGAEEGYAGDHGVARPAARVPRLQVAVRAEPGVVVVVGLNTGVHIYHCFNSCLSLYTEAATWSD